jgi:hypothetical protein
MLPALVLVVDELLLTDAPSEVAIQQLPVLHIRLNLAEN